MLVCCMLCGPSAIVRTTQVDLAKARGCFNTATRIQKWATANAAAREEAKHNRQAMWE